MLIASALFVSACLDATAPMASKPGLLVSTDKPSAPQLPTEPSDTISIAAVGDIMMGSPFPDDSRMPPNDGRDILSSAAGILRNADIAFGNLEGPLADGGISEKCGEGRANCYAFRMPTHYAKYLKDAGFDVMSVANNHAGDFGSAGRASTRTSLDKMGIKYAGSDRGKYSTAYLTVGDKKVAFIGFATNAISLNLNSLASARAAVKAADKNADIVVVSFHGGAEGAANKRVPRRTELFFGEKRGNLPLFARTVIDAGADLVLGHGPHVLRGMEIYKGRLIAYSLGNFATYGWFRLQKETAESMILVANIGPEGEFLGGMIHPFKLVDWGVPSMDDSGSAISTIKRLSALDFPRTSPSILDDGTLGQQ
jgi:poly-gamma-glutamate capsule biosynthesis protein CapA/YwtB (metallophosphatase superfamily)